MRALLQDLDDVNPYTGSSTCYSGQHVHGLLYIKARINPEEEIVKFLTCKDHPMEIWKVHRECLSDSLTF